MFSRGRERTGKTTPCPASSLTCDRPRLRASSAHTARARQPRFSSQSKDTCLPLSLLLSRSSSHTLNWQRRQRQNAIISPSHPSCSSLSFLHRCTLHAIMHFFFSLTAVVTCVGKTLSKFPPTPFPSSTFQNGSNSAALHPPRREDLRHHHLP